MKNILITILFITIGSNISAQENLPYKPLVDFETDTTAFLRYNFIDRENQYIGKTLDDVINDMQIPVTNIVLLFGHGRKERFLFSITLNIYDRERTHSIVFNNRDKIHGIVVDWEEAIERDEKIKEIADTKPMDVDINTALDYFRSFKNKISEVTLVRIADDEYYSRHRKDPDPMAPIIKGDTIIIPR